MIIKNKKMNHLQTQRNHSIDLLKAICAFLVIVIHINWIYQYNTSILSLTRCAVPCFFMISGYFYVQGGGRRNIKHLLKITLWSTLFFIVWKEIFLIVHHDIYIPSPKQMRCWLFFNDCPFSYQLWYLYAYIYVLIIIGLIEKFNKWKLLFRSIPILLFGTVVFYYLLIIIQSNYTLYIFCMIYKHFNI